MRLECERLGRRDRHLRGTPLRTVCRRHLFGGEAAVRGYFAASRIRFPDQTNEIIAIWSRLSGGQMIPLPTRWAGEDRLPPLSEPRAHRAPRNNMHEPSILAVAALAKRLYEARMRIK